MSGDSVACIRRGERRMEFGREDEGGKARGKARREARVFAWGTEWISPSLSKTKTFRSTEGPVVVVVLSRQIWERPSNSELSTAAGGKQAQSSPIPFIFGSKGRR